MASSGTYVHFPSNNLEKASWVIKTPTEETVKYFVNGQARVLEYFTEQNAIDVAANLTLDDYAYNLALYKYLVPGEVQAGIDVFIGGSKIGNIVAKLRLVALAALDSTQAAALSDAIDALLIIAI